ncbi:MAG: 50S ribosomal protein L32 [Bacillota bacterium]
MGVPKRRTSKQRKRTRRAQVMKIAAPQLVPCPQCKAPVMPHRVCPECGYYKAKKVINDGK